MACETRLSTNRECLRSVDDFRREETSFICISLYMTRLVFRNKTSRGANLATPHAFAKSTAFVTLSREWRRADKQGVRKTPLDDVTPGCDLFDKEESTAIPVASNPKQKTRSEELEITEKGHSPSRTSRRLLDDHRTATQNSRRDLSACRAFCARRAANIVHIRLARGKVSIEARVAKREAEAICSIR